MSNEVVQACVVGFGVWVCSSIGVSFWFVVGEINPLRQYVAKKYTCIDLASNFLQIFRMQIIFPRPGGGTIAAGNRDIDKNGGSKKYGFLVHRPGHKMLAPGSAAAILGGPF